MRADGAARRPYPSQKNFVGRSISGGRLLCTGQLSAALSSNARCGVLAGSGMGTSEGSPMMRRGASFDISLLTFTVIPFTSSPCSWAAIARIVLMQVPSAVATRSVGEKDSPLPLLSVGASVAILACDGPWTASQCRSPVYWMEMLIIFVEINYNKHRQILNSNDYTYFPH